jgi:hypothetical protein
MIGCGGAYSTEKNSMFAIKYNIRTVGGTIEGWLRALHVCLQCQHGVSLVETLQIKGLLMIPAHQHREGDSGATSWK